MVFDEAVEFLVSILHHYSQTAVSYPIYSLRHGILAGLLILASAEVTADESTVTLKARNQQGELTKVQAVVELSGELKLNPDGKKLTKLPLKGTGDLVYEERLVAIGNADQPRTDVRHYQAAEARFVVGDSPLTTKLSDDRRLIGVSTRKSQSTVYSPLGPLSKDELELIDIQGSSTLFHRLLPEKDVEPGEKWTLSDETVAMLLRWDVVTENKLECTFKRVEEGVAQCEISGTASGSTSGISSDVDVNAKYNFDLSQKRVSWLAMSLHEIRAVGHAEPGFDVTARIRVVVQPLESSVELADDVVSSLPLDGEEAATYLTHVAADGALQMILPRSWKVMVDRHDVTILRFIDRGEMIAQCNLSKLTDAAPDKLLTMESFQSDIQRSLDKNFGEFVDARQFKTERGLRALRVVASGVASDLPIQWIYYHVTDDAGHQAAIVFTLDAKLVERFGGEDQTAMSSFEILPVKKTATTAKAEAAKKNPTSKK